ncbi:3-isopropylmalate dehydratase small subunit [Teichococcus wenyumeiae]|uniref:hypothetical protein n=1 Tax=Teichococcus wenyumeiae TaxID=2478470 RepID=UPI0018F6B8D4
MFRENCLRNAILPVTLPEEAHAHLSAAVAAADGKAEFQVDLTAQRITGPHGFMLAFDIAPVKRIALLEGLDDIALTPRSDAAIAAYEAT